MTFRLNNSKRAKRTAKFSEIDSVWLIGSMHKKSNHTQTHTIISDRTWTTTTSKRKSKFVRSMIIHHQSNPHIKSTTKMVFVFIRVFSALFFFCVFYRCIINGTSKYVKTKNKTPNTNHIVISLILIIFGLKVFCFPFCFDFCFVWPIPFFLYFFFCCEYVWFNSPSNEMTSVTNTQCLRHFIRLFSFVFRAYFAVFFSCEKWVASVLFTIPSTEWNS